jgi:hypothetical protein
MGHITHGRNGPASSISLEGGGFDMSVNITFAMCDEVCGYLVRRNVDTAYCLENLLPKHDALIETEVLLNQSYFRCCWDFGTADAYVTTTYILRRSAPAIVERVHAG